MAHVRAHLFPINSADSKLEAILALTRASTSICRWGYYRYWQLPGKKKCVTQLQLNKTYEGPDFLLAGRYGAQLTITFATMLFSAGLPLLYLVSAASFASSYWLEKAELLKLSRIPPHYTADLALFAGEGLASSRKGSGTAVRGSRARGDTLYSVPDDREST